MTTNEQVLDILKKGNANKAAISEATGIKGIVLVNALRKLQTEGHITSHTEGDETTYSVVEPKTEEQPIVTEEIQPVIVAEEIQATNEQAGQAEQPATIVDGAGKEEAKEEDKPDAKATVTKATVGRDNTKYIFEKETYGKGKLVVAVLKKWVADRPSTTYAQLKEVFPDTLMKRFGVFEEIKKAKEISGTRDRYFFKEEDIIKLGDKKQIVICSQWTAALISEFIKTSKANGLKIKEA